MDSGTVNARNIAGRDIHEHHYPERDLTFPLIHLPPHNPHFTGRDDLLNAIQSSFANQQSSIALTQAIAGLAAWAKRSWRWPTPTASEMLTT